MPSNLRGTAPPPHSRTPDSCSVFWHVLIGKVQISYPGRTHLHKLPHHTPGLPAPELPPWRAAAWPHSPTPKRAVARREAPPASAPDCHCRRPPHRRRPLQGVLARTAGVIGRRMPMERKDTRYDPVPAVQFGHEALISPRPIRCLHCPFPSKLNFSTGFHFGLQQQCNTPGCKWYPTKRNPFPTFELSPQQLVLLCQKCILALQLLHSVFELQQLLQANKTEVP